MTRDVDFISRSLTNYSALIHSSIMNIMSIIYFCLLLCVVHYVLVVECSFGMGSTLGKRKSPAAGNGNESDLNVHHDKIPCLTKAKSENEGGIPGNVVASSLQAQAFMKALEEEELETAKEVLINAGLSRKSWDKQLINLGQYEDVLVALYDEMLDYEADEHEDEGTDGTSIRGWILNMIFSHASQQVVDIVLNGMFLGENLSYAMKYSKLTDNINEFINFLKRITKDKSKNLKYAVEGAVESMVLVNKHECLNSLLSALQSEFPDPELVNVAIRRAFEDASTYNSENNLIAKNFFNHSAVNANSYFLVLYNSYVLTDYKRGHFYWLLDRADYQDLKMVKKHQDFSEMPSQFQNAINNVLEKVGNETRRQKDERILREFAKFVKAALGNTVPDVLINMILEYRPDW